MRKLCTILQYHPCLLPLLYHSFSDWRACHLHLPQHLLYSVMYVALRWTEVVALPCRISSSVLSLHCQICIVSFATVYIGMALTTVIILIRGNVFRLGIVIGSIFVCVLISKELRRARCECCTWVVTYFHTQYSKNRTLTSFLIHIFKNTTTLTQHWHWYPFLCLDQFLSLLLWTQSFLLPPSTVSFSSFTPLLSTMSRRCKPLCACSFPGDPRYATMTLTATEAEFACLWEKEFLISSVLDSIFAVDSIAEGCIWRRCPSNDCELSLRGLDGGPQWDWVHDEQRSIRVEGKSD